MKRDAKSWLGLSSGAGGEFSHPPHQFFFFFLLIALYLPYFYNSESKNCPSFHYQENT